MAERRNGSAEASLLEWIAAATGLALLLGVLAVIGWEALHGDPGEPPTIALQVRRIAPSAGGFVVEIEAFNRSGGTAQSVEIEGALRGVSAPIETSSVSFDYIPGHSRRIGGLFFREDPRRHRLDLRALGYQEP